MGGPLDLSGADLKGFEALEPGRYNAEIFEISWDATKNPDGKMPVGTRMMKVQFKLTDPEVENRRVFTQYVVPPNDYDAKKKATMQGMIARFFMATGDPEELVTSKKFNPDFEDYKGRPVVVTLSKEQYPKDSDPPEYQNRVKGVKPAGAAVGASSGLL